MEVSSLLSNMEASRQEALIRLLSRTSSLHSQVRRSSRHLLSRHHQLGEQELEHLTPSHKPQDLIHLQLQQVPIHLPQVELKNSSPQWLRASWEMMTTSQSALQPVAKRRSKRLKLSSPQRKRRPRKRLMQSSATRENLQPSSSWITSRVTSAIPLDKVAFQLQNSQCLSSRTILNVLSQT